MKAIDTKSWAEFKVGDLFDINSSKKIYHAINVTIIPTQEDGYYPYVVRQKSNNGIRGYIQEDLESLNPANTISFAQDTAEMFWQSQPYFTGNKVKVMSVKNQELTELISLFLISGLKRAFSNFRYISSYTVDNIKNVALKLPIQQIIDPDKTYHPEGYIPDWDYMEAFMEQINQQAQARLNEHKEGKLEYTTLDSKIGYTPVDTKSWAEFKVGDLFEIENGKYVDPKTLTSDDNGSPYLTASIFNNGQNTDKYTGEGFKTKPNIISWGKQSPLFSYHTEACYTGQGIYWFEFDKGQNVAHFICTVLQNVGKNYNYQNCLTGAKLKQETIKLPIDQTGQPDWDYMEAFMKQINQQAQAKLDTLEKGNI